TESNIANGMPPDAAGNRRLTLRIGEQTEPVVQPSWRSQRAFRVDSRQPGHYAGFGVTSGWAVIRPYGSLPLEPILRR
ncbi:MAG TPA: hypothetical protein VI386_02835, partial [Candidatus Sulfotelmatobacter sp.]